jgi:hypothetical protein
LRNRAGGAGGALAVREEVGVAVGPGEGRCLVFNLVVRRRLRFCRRLRRHRRHRRRRLVRGRVGVLPLAHSGLGVDVLVPPLACRHADV